MKRNKWVYMMVALLLVGLFAFDALAEEGGGAGVDFGVEGYYRIRYDNIMNTEWNFDDESDWWTYFNQRMLLEPSFIINDKVKLVMQLDLLRNVTFGSNENVRVPVALVERSPSDQEQIDTVNLNSFDLRTGNIFSQEMSYTDAILQEEVDPVRIRRLYGEVKLPIGVLRAGRQGSNFGLGIFSNDGDGLDSDFGDTYDRILFATKAGPYVPVLVYDKVVEDDYKVADTDVHQFVFVNYIKNITWKTHNAFDAGLYLMHRTQQSTDAKIFAYDLWFRFNLGGFRLESETAALQGKFTAFDHDTVSDLKENGLPTGEGGGKVTVDAYINAEEFWYETEQWGVGAGFGFSSPADPNPENEFSSSSAGQIALAKGLAEGDEESAQSSIDFINAVVENQSAFGTHAYSFPFDPDYNVDLIVWEILMGGAVKNGIYAKASGYVYPLDMFKIRVDLIQSWINESGKGKNGKDADHNLGLEIDTDFAATVADHFTFGVQLGYAFTGQYFRDVYEGVENVFTVQSRFVFEF
jgi:uncharacterized protein (TIGR04551 family)